MVIDLSAFLTFVLVTTFTPGPNNISCASMGVLYGYRRTVRYLLRISTGFFLIMLLCGLVSTALLGILPSFETVLRIIGAGYILWLAYHTLRASYTFQTDDDQARMGYGNGFLLQLLNPKVIVYGLTLYSTFLAPISGRPLLLGLSALFLAAVAFCATSTWALFGSAIKTYLRRPGIRQAVNTLLSLLLVWTAVELSGILSLLW